MDLLTLALAKGYTNKTISEKVNDIDNLSITLNSDNEIQAIGALDQNTGRVNKYWTGTQVEYNGLVEKDEDTFYIITDYTDEKIIDCYLKSETYSKEEINDLISSINSFSVMVVDTLPAENIDTHTIYLIPKANEANDNYDEYIYINNNWEHIGSTSIDLTEYYTKSEVDTAINNAISTIVNGNEVSY